MIRGYFALQHPSISVPQKLSQSLWLDFAGFVEVFLFQFLRPLILVHTFLSSLLRHSPALAYPFSQRSEVWI